MTGIYLTVCAVAVNVLAAAYGYTTANGLQVVIAMATLVCVSVPMLAWQIEERDRRIAEAMRRHPAGKSL